MLITGRYSVKRSKGCKRVGGLGGPTIHAKERKRFSTFRPFRPVRPFRLRYGGYLVNEEINFHREFYARKERRFLM